MEDVGFVSTQALGQGVDQFWWRFPATVLLAVGIGMTIAAAQAAASEPNAIRELSVSHGWMRVLMPPIPAAGYFTLTNHGTSTFDLVGASSPACRALMLHESRDRSGTEKMVMVSKVQVPAHGSIAFAPGGYHLMCMSPATSLKPGTAVPVTLKFAGGETITARFEVRRPTGK
ncbi:MAG TPA: copper chaperone PCu(A)C [Rhodanobacter sp.]|nr:copper chaperone PCu(A)C [Rhodanobacter sp.]